MMKYFDGNISELEMEQLMRHLQKCKNCAEEFEVLREALFEIEELPDIEPSAELTANIMTAVYSQSSQKRLQVSKRQLICWLVGFIGLVMFTYNIIAFAILPTISGGVPLFSTASMFRGIYWLGNLMKDGIVAISISLGKLLIIRDIILKDYTMLVIIWAVAFSIVDFMLYKLINMKRKKNDFVNNN